MEADRAVVAGSHASAGGRWTDHRAVFDVVAFKYRNNLAWRDPPAERPPWQTVFDRFACRARDEPGSASRRAAIPGGCRRGSESARRRRLHDGPCASARGGARKGAPVGEPADHALGDLAVDRRSKPTTRPTAGVVRSRSS
ncbi:transposase [Embleya sp. NPDC020886]|uniref:transposase n=1 Tax=Embleya sp. NPDC020886 TaxID=3363980 RepID=UPI0037ABFF16